MNKSLRYDSYGGLRVKKFEATGFFRLEKQGERWFFVTPEGHPYYMLGMNTVTPWFYNFLNNGFEKVYGGDSIKWGDAAVGRCREWGFNCLTYKTAECLIKQMEVGKIDRMPYAPVLKFIENDATKREDFPDPWGVPFEKHMDAVASNLTAIKDSPWVVGYFIINEMDCDLHTWMNRWLRTLLRADSPPATRVFRQILAHQYETVNDFNEKYGTNFPTFADVEPWVVSKAFRDGKEYAEKDMQLFNAALTRQFYKLAHDAIKRYDPNHLILGSRFATDAEPFVLKGVKSFTDVISLNRYFQIGTFDYLFDGLEKMHTHSGLPVLHSEFSWLIEGRDGVYPSAPSQKARGEAYEDWMLRALMTKSLIGTCWYGYVDGGWVTEPGGEVMNFGLIDIHDNPYEEALEGVVKANKEIMREFSRLFKEKKVVTREGTSDE